MSNNSVIEVIKHYQRSIEKYNSDEKRVLHCIGKLSNLPVKVNHLQETGIGRTVNSLRKYEGPVGHAARTLVAKWKEMVAADSSNSEVEDNSDAEQHDIRKQNGQQLEDEDDDDDEEEEGDKNEHIDKKNGENSDEYNRGDIDDSKRKINDTDEDEEANIDLNNYNKSISDKCEKRKSEEHQHHKSRSEETDEHKKHKKKNHSKKHSHHSSDRKHKSDKIDDIKLLKDKTGDSKSTSSKKNYSSSERSKNEHNNKHEFEYSPTKNESHSNRHKSNSSKYETHTNKHENNSEKQESNSNKYETISSKHEDYSSKHDSNSSKHESSSSSRRESDFSKHESILIKHESDSEKKIKKDKSCDYDKKSSSKSKSTEENQDKISSSHKHKHKSSNKESHHSSVESTSSKHKSEKKHNKDTSGTKSKSKSHHKTDSKRKHVDTDSTSAANSQTSDEEGIDSFSGTSFAEALGMVSPPKKKLKTSTITSNSSISSPKLSTKSQPSSSSYSNSVLSDDDKPELLTPNAKLPQLNLDINLPTITPNYQPLPQSDMLWSLNNKNNKRTEEEQLSFSISSKNQRTKVYSGNKTSYGYVPSLFELCLRILQDNIDALEYTGGVPYSILLPVLERATPEQLYTLEDHNAYLLEDTDVLWEQHCKREFRSKHRNEMETWREAYFRFLLEREEKLKSLTANIKQSMDKSVPVRQTKLAYVDSVVKPPRAIARKQAKYGTGNSAKPMVTPASRVASLASSSSNISVPNPGARAASHSSGSISKPKKAPLMQKTLALIKSTNRYRR